MRRKNADWIPADEFAQAIWEWYNSHMDTSTLHQLPNDEKLRIIFELWDDLASSNAPIQLPHEIIVEAHRRREELIANPEIAIDDEEMWRRVDG